MGHYSLRRRLVGGIVSAVLLILGAIGGITYQAMQQEADEIFRARLASSARVFEALVGRQLAERASARPLVLSLPADSRGEAGDADPGEQEGGKKIAFQVWNELGILLARSDSAPSSPLAPLVEGSSSQRLGDGAWEVFALRSGGTWVLAAEHNDTVAEKRERLAAAVYPPFLLGTLLLVALVNWLIVHHLRPMESLAAKIASREPESLEPIRLAPSPQELRPVIDELNALLERVTRAFQREQKFIDAAAHEIRTPLAALQLHVENALQANGDAERDESLRQALAGLRRLTRLSEQLLAFSRVTSRTDGEAPAYLALEALCQSQAEAQAALLAQRRQRIRIAADGDCVIRGEPGKVERLLQNLIDNASRYGASPGCIDIEMRRAGRCLELAVSNEGEPIPAAEKEKIFLSYYRIPGSKSPGSGLGLAIVREIASQLGAAIRVEDKAPGEGARFVVRFPAAQGD